MIYKKARFINDRSFETAYERARQQWLEETWPKILQQAKATGAVILFGDEVSFAMWGSLSRTWAVRGQQPLVKTRGMRKGLKMFGAISPGRVDALIYPTKLRQKHGKFFPGNRLRTVKSFSLSRYEFP